jgi:hypothetical protein
LGLDEAKDETTTQLIFIEKAKNPPEGGFFVV